MRKFISLIIKYKKTVLVATLAVTIGLLAQLKSLQVIIDPDSTLPQNHPYIATGNFIEKTFGNKFTIVIGVTAKEGDVFQSKILEKVQRITTAIMNAPGAVKNNISSLSARKSKDIQGSEEGMTVKPLLDKIPQTEIELSALRNAISRNPVFENLLISKDKRTTQIVAEFKKIEGGFQAIEKIVQEVVGKEKDGSVEINV